MRPKTVSIIIPVWNGQETIGRCIASLLGQTFPRDRTQIIVVDNGSTDRTVEIVRRFDGVLLVEEPVASSYRARNSGLAHATGDLIAFTDADCEPAPRWIEAGVAATEQDQTIGVAAGHVELVPVPDGPSSKTARLFEQMFAFRQEDAARLGHSVTANWMSPRSVFEQIGKFDPDLKSGGDWQLSAKIAEAGLAVRYVPEMLVYHPTRSTIGELVAKRRRVVGGMWTREGGHRSLPKLLFFVVAEAAKRSGAVLLRSGYSLIDRLRVVTLLIMLAAAAVVELGRLMLGGEPRRS